MLNVSKAHSFGGIKQILMALAIKCIYRCCFMYSVCFYLHIAYNSYALLTTKQIQTQQTNSRENHFIESFYFVIHHYHSTLTLY